MLQRESVQLLKSTWQILEGSCMVIISSQLGSKHVDGRHYIEDFARTRDNTGMLLRKGDISCTLMLQ
jgi:hypothetical protein